MSGTIETDVCVIGAGSGGLLVAAGAAQLGARTVLVERGRMGGECLNAGCVPSKALLAAARAAQEIREAGRFGIRAGEPEIDFPAVMAHVQGVIAAIAPSDSVERYQGFGVNVIAGAARFVAGDAIEAAGRRIRARRFVIATGSCAAVPPIPGLDALPYLTNETLWDLRERPRHLLVLGGGATGMEMAQAFRRLGAAVTVVEAARVLPGEDPEIAALLRDRLAAEGVRFLEGVRVAAAEPHPEGVALAIADGERIAGSHLLVAAGRRPNVEGLGLEAAGVALTDAGWIAVDARLRTANRRIHAIGDVTGRALLTSVAGWHAGVALRDILFRLPAKAADMQAVPRVVYTDPELAHVGLDEAAARAEGHPIDVQRFPLADNNRAQTERRTEGLIKVVAGRRGRILGATILAPGAGELILPWAMALRERASVTRLAGLVPPYPTRSEITKAVTTGFIAPRLLTERTRRIVRFLLKLG